jgi:hypothetical protein
MIAATVTTGIVFFCDTSRSHSVVVAIVNNGGRPRYGVFIAVRRLSTGRRAPHYPETADAEFLDD